MLQRAKPNTRGDNLDRVAGAAPARRSGLHAAGVFALGWAAPAKEETMANDPFHQFVMPNEMRALMEQTVAHARTTFDGFMQAANKAIGQFEGNAEAARSGANEIAHKSMAYAEQNMAATFAFAHKLMQAKDASDLMALQSEFLSRQVQTLSTQVQDLGQSAAKIVMDAAKPKP
jgi:phasin